MIKATQPSQAWHRRKFQSFYFTLAWRSILIWRNEYKVWTAIYILCTFSWYQAIHQAINRAEEPPNMSLRSPSIYQRNLTDRSYIHKPVPTSSFIILESHVMLSMIVGAINLSSRQLPPPYTTFPSEFIRAYVKIYVIFTWFSNELMLKFSTVKIRTFYHSNSNHIVG